MESNKYRACKRSGLVAFTKGKHYMGLTIDPATVSARPKKFKLELKV